ncbi:MAG: HlyD family secretion protein [Pseudanabaena sp.]|nr:MAG: HlyD family secretion protein [Pseudanabaena sp.]
MAESVKRQPPDLRLLVGIGIASIVLVGGVGIYLFTQKNTDDSISPNILTKPVVQSINALGRLEPKNQVVKVSAPTSMGSGSRILQLLVNEGDLVKANQVIAVLDSRDRLQANLVESQRQVELAKAKLEQVLAGAKQGEVSANVAAIARLEADLNGEIQTQKANIRKLQAGLENAKSELQRNQSLFDQGAISNSSLDTRRLTFATAQAELNAAEATLERTQTSLKEQVNQALGTLDQTLEVRPSDIAAAQVEVDLAIATVAKNKAELDLAFVRSPAAGRILKINTRSSETIGSNGIVELGQTEQMVVVAEVYESDIAKVKEGQSVKITSPSGAFTNQLSGKVAQIGFKVAKQDVLNTDPTAATDARVIEVKILLDSPSSQQVERFTNMQVNVEIFL